jgi:hypothetical protein
VAALSQIAIFRIAGDVARASAPPHANAARLAGLAAY